MFVKDPATGFVINTDESMYKTILAHRKSEKNARAVKDKVDTLESELRDIRALLKQVVNRD